MIRCLLKVEPVFFNFALLLVLCSPPRAFTQAAAPLQTETSVPSLEHQSAQSPSVTFHDGELSIVAFNSTLRDVLELVGSKTGASIDIEPGANERVFVKLGPGPVRQVLDSLLAGSSFNYILLGSAADPKALSKVVLSAKPSGNSDNEKEAQALMPAQGRVSRRSGQAEAAEEVEGAAQTVAQQEPAIPTTKVENEVKSEKNEAIADTSSPASVESSQAASPPAQSATEFQRTPNIRTAQEVLQDLYARRQAMQQQQPQRQ